MDVKRLTRPPKGLLWLSIALVVVLIVLAVDVMLFTKLIDRDRTYKNSTAELQILAQDMAKNALGAADAKAEAFVSLRKGRDEFAYTMQKLQADAKRRNWTTSSDQSRIQQLKHLQDVWQVNLDAIDLILANRVAVLGLHQKINDLNGVLPVVADEVDALAEALVAHSVRINTISLVFRQLGSLEKIRSAANVLSHKDADVVVAATALAQDAESFEQVIGGLVVGDQALELPRLDLPKFSQHIETIQNEFFAAKKLFTPMIAEARTYADVLQAKDTIYKNSNLLQTEAKELAGVYENWTVLQDISGTTSELLAWLAVVLAAWIAYRYYWYNKYQRLQSQQEKLAQQDVVNQLQGEMSVASKQITSGLTSANAQQKRTIADVSAAINNLSAGVGVVAANAKQCNQDWFANLGAIKQNIRLVQDTLSCVAGTEAKLDATSVHLQNLQNHCHDLGNIPTASKEVAEQAKLLALNAAIQLAAADKVSPELNSVVENLHQLADKIFQAALSIDQLVIATQQSTEQAQASIHHGSVAVTKGRQLGTAAVDKLTVLDKNATRLAKQLDEMTTVANKHAKALGNVVDMIAKIENSNSQSTDGVEETKQSLHRLAEYVTVLHKSVDRQQADAGAISPNYTGPKLKPFDLQHSLSAKELE